MENKMDKGKEKNNSKRPLYIGLIVLLLLINGFLAYNTLSTKKKADQLEIERTELQTMYDSVLVEYNLTKADIEELMGINDELDRELEMRLAELESARTEIEDLLQKNQVTSRQLADAQRLIRSLRAENERFASQIDSLTTVTADLMLERESLTADLEQERNIRQELQDERVGLSRKVELGSLFDLEGLEAEGVRYRNNGREVSTRNSRRVEKLKVCFTALENRVADEGQKSLHIRIISPEGSTIAVQNLGSGTFVNAETGEQMQFTTKADFDYQGDSRNLCVYWSQTAAFSGGNYNVEIYQSGYLIDKTEFSLR
ncbi:MAG: hypothetical protein EA412_02655 [Chitinophagaceae bacterium]|nr:MAG: hypothetical protein EA412_02655 [Chitinophagaceae bacterium]